MKRILTVTVLLAALAAPTKEMTLSTDQQCAVQILVGKAKAVEVVVPCVDRNSMTEIVSTFLSRDNKQADEQLRRVLKEAGDVTLTITTTHGGPTPPH